MAIQFVGGIGSTFSGGSGGSLSLTALTGGIGAAAQSGDIVIVARGTGLIASNASLPLTGYTQIADLYANQTRDSGPSGDTDQNQETYYKLMGGTPDTSVVIASFASAHAAYGMVFRGVDQTTPLDVAATTATQTATDTIDPPSITTAHANACAVIFGQNATSSGSVAISSGYTTNGYLLASKLFLYGGYKILTAAGAENPGAFTLSAPKGHSSVAITIALRAATAGGQAKVWSGSAWVAKPVKVWSGSAWVTKPVKFWNGSSWVTTTY